MSLLVSQSYSPPSFQTMLRRRSGFWEHHRAAAILLGSVSR